MKNRKKEITMLIIVILVLITLIIGATYAYFKAQTNSSKTFDIKTTTGTVDSLTFSTVDEISLSVDADNLKNSGEDVSDASIAKARLIANNTTNYAEGYYNVYFLIEENDIEYSSYKKDNEIKTFMTKEEKRKADLEGYEGIHELVISIKKNGKEYTKEIDRLTKLNDGSYDITEEEGLYAIAENEKIISNGDETDEWEITVTYKNLNYNQQLNVGNSLTGKVIITPETLINKIQTINDLVDLSNEVNGGDTKEGKYYVLTRDLDFNEIEDYRDNREELQQELTNKNGEGFIPIGNSATNSFQGNFDGGKHTLSNIYINNTTADIFLGLFGVISNSKISNITLTGEMKTSVKAGIGIIGETRGISIIRKCVNKTKMSSQASGWQVGGLVGSLGKNGILTINKCENYGKIIGGNNTGGIIGFNNNGNLTIEDCHNYGTVTNNVGQNAGGILGRDNSTSNVTTITNTTNEGQVTSTKTSDYIYLGGLVGRAYGTLNIENSQNLKNNEETKITVEFSGNVLSYIGGIMGIADGATVIMDSVTNEQSIEATNNSANEIKVGGLLGYIRNKGSIEINNSENKAGINVTSNNANIEVGGIIGYSYNSNSENRNIIKIKNVENNTEDKIISTSNKVNRVGGIIGDCQNAIVEIEDVKNKQKIETNSNGSSESRSGGIIGNVNKSMITINTSNNMERLIVTNNGTGATRTGGIIGCVEGKSNVDINNSQNIGNLEPTQNGTGDAHTGGIIGYINSNSNVKINESSSIGLDITISKAANNVPKHVVGGIIGYAFNSIATITKSYNTTNVQGGTRFGGIIGYSNNNSKVLIDKCYNTGNFETNFEASDFSITLGGIIGYNGYGSTAYITNSYNTGNLKNIKDTSNVRMSGIVGDIYSTDNVVNTYVANSYNIGNITNTTNTNNVNGIFEDTPSSIESKGYVNNVYNAGELFGTKKYGIGLTGKGEYNITNAYYLEGEGIIGSDKENIGIPKTEIEIKGLTDTLNNNISSIELSTLKEDFPEYNLTFSNWKLGENGYPTLDF